MRIHHGARIRILPRLNPWEKRKILLFHPVNVLVNVNVNVPRTKNLPFSGTFTSTSTCT
jgi:hypothetical protein